MTRVRIPIAQILFDTGLVAALILLAAIMVCEVEPAFGADEVFIANALPYYNADGTSTKYIVVNPTEASIELPGDGQIYGCVCPKPSVAAHGYKELSAKKGIGVEIVALPASLIAYSEVTTPHGVPIPIFPLTARETSYVSRLMPTTKGENAGLFIAAETDSVVQVLGGESFRLKAGEGRVTSAPTDNATVLNTWGGAGGYGTVSGRLYVFGFRNQWSTGAVTVYAAH